MTVGVWDLTRWDQSVWAGESTTYTPLLEDYTALVSAVTSLLKDSGVSAAQTELFIRQAHDKLVRDLMDEQYGGEIPAPMIVHGTTTSNADSSITVPADYVTTRSIRVGNAVLRYASPDHVPKNAPGFGEAAVELVYYARPPLLSNSNPSNWILERSPDCYLYGAAVQYVPWGHEPAVLQLWNDFYTDAVRGTKKTYAARPRGGWGRRKATRHGGVYTVFGNTMIFGPGARSARSASFLGAS